MGSSVAEMPDGVGSLSADAVRGESDEAIGAGGGGTCVTPFTSWERTDGRCGMESEGVTVSGTFWSRGGAPRRNAGGPGSPDMGDTLAVCTGAI